MNSDIEIGQIKKLLEDRSKRLFGKKHRLPLGGLIAVQEAHVWARQLAKALDIGENQAAGELGEFEKLGAVQQLPATYDRRKIFQVVSHPLWAFMKTATEECIRASDPEKGDALVAQYWATVKKLSDPERILEKGS